LDTSQKQDRKIIQGFLAGRKEDYQTITRWISGVVRLGSWGLGRYSDDIIQDALLKLYINLKENRFQFRSGLKTYVYQISKFTCIDYLRKHSSKEQKEVRLVENRTIDPREDEKRKEQEEFFWRIYNLTSEECRHLWQMIFWENLSYSQIAQKLNLKGGTIKSRFARCKEKAIWLRKKLTEKEEPF